MREGEMEPLLQGTLSSTAAQPYLLHPSDALVQRNTSALGNYVTLNDEEGVPLFSFPGEWTNEQLEIVLRFANMTYARGHRMGGYDKTREIQRVLTCD